MTQTLTLWRYVAGLMQSCGQPSLSAIEAVINHHLTFAIAKCNY